MFLKCGGKQCIISDEHQDDESCRSTNTSGTGWACTLPDGHDGDHIACSSNDHDLSRWPNYPEDVADAPEAGERFQLTLNREEGEIILALIGNIGCHNDHRRDVINDLYGALCEAGLRNCAYDVLDENGDELDCYLGNYNYRDDEG